MVWEVDVVGEGILMMMNVVTYWVMNSPPPLMIPLPLMLASQCALLDSCLCSSSLFTHTLLLDANRCLSPIMATIPRRQADWAFTPAVLNYLLRFIRITLLSCSDPYPLPDP